MVLATLDFSDKEEGVYPCWFSKVCPHVTFFFVLFKVRFHSGV